MFTSMSPLLLEKVQVKDYFQREALLMFVCVLQVLLFFQEEEEESSPETQMKKRENPWSLCQHLFFFLSLSPPVFRPLHITLSCSPPSVTL